MKHALITGGAGGIGQAISAYFSQNGWKVYSCDIAPQKTSDENIISIKMDITSSKSVAKARTIVENETGRLDAIINLAGIYLMDSLVEIPEDDFVGIFNINVNGAYRVNKEFLPFCASTYCKHHHSNGVHIYRNDCVRLLFTDSEQL